MVHIQILKELSVSDRPVISWDRNFSILYLSLFIFQQRQTAANGFFRCICNILVMSCWLSLSSHFLNSSDKNTKNPEAAYKSSRLLSWGHYVLRFYFYTLSDNFWVMRLIRIFERWGHSRSPFQSLFTRRNLFPKPKLILTCCFQQSLWFLAWIQLLLPTTHVPTDIHDS